MAVQDAVRIGRSLAVMVRLQGPDPKRLKMRKHAFHKYNSGNTTLSASGMLLPDSLYDAESVKRASGGNQRNTALVVTVASVVEPFLSLQHRMDVAKDQPQLVSGAQVSILVEDYERTETNPEIGTPNWLPAQLLTFVDVPESAFALQSLLDASSSSGGQGWEIGWSLASQTNTTQPFMDLLATERIRRMTGEESANSSTMGKSLTKLAILGISFSPKVLPSINLTSSSARKRGDLVISVASPFGVLSPMHFLNSVSMGSIANYYPPNSPSKLLLIADIRCLPGMEGGPVLDENGGLIGILSRPLNQESSGAEVQLLIPWEAVATACNHALLKENQVIGNDEKTGEEVNHNQRNTNSLGRAFLYNSCEKDVGTNNSHNDTLFASAPAFEKAMASVCLVTIDDRFWASGILLNDQGLVLTNAHLLEPWRFGKTPLNGELNGTEPEQFSSSERFHPNVTDSSDRYGDNQSMKPSIPQILNSTVDSKVGQYDSSSIFGGHKRIRVRLDHMQPWIWCNAEVVHVCKGNLDIALLQLVDAPGQLSPIAVDLASPPLGSRVHVIGHGLFGPRCGFLPSVSSGVVAKVVKARLPEFYSSVIQADSQGESPAMLETTAAVHPGSSGGLVVNADGYMIGLITSNARHGRGTVIPHLNFSIPSAALAPIFKFSRDMQDVSLLHNLDRPDKNLSFVWELIPPLSQKPVPRVPGLPPSLVEGNKKEGKGSRFANFVIENDLLKESTQLRRERRPPGRTLPSKL